MPKHPALLHEINEMSMRIKVWHLNKDELTKEQFDKLTERLPKVEWQEVEDLLMRAHRAINEQREDPRKY